MGFGMELGRSEQVFEQTGDRVGGWVNGWCSIVNGFNIAVINDIVLSRLLPPLRTVFWVLARLGARV